MTTADLAALRPGDRVRFDWPDPEYPPSRGTVRNTGEGWVRIDFGPNKEAGHEQYETNLIVMDCEQGLDTRHERLTREEPEC